MHRSLVASSPTGWVFGLCADVEMLESSYHPATSRMINVHQDRSCDCSLKAARLPGPPPSDSCQVLHSKNNKIRARKQADKIWFNGFNTNLEIKLTLMELMKQIRLV